ncbi:unnamed protein product [Euphydryas editha]|uniref:Uncharacterized protein n=1 Tax=Euphydryas editha TaxID=104508 RepID=A0AAU9UPL7_EUPED|nr:unnamed protein product [Euphydryas editha]
MTIEWKMSETVQHTYKKKTANDKNISMLTKKTTKTNKTGTVQLLVDALEADIPKFKTHVFNFLHQNVEYKNCKEHLDENEAAIHYENVALNEEIECVSIDENFNSQVIDMEQHIEDNVATKVTVVNEEIDSVLTNENINNQVIDIEHNAEPNATTEITVCNEDIESIKENINSQV